MMLQRVLVLLLLSTHWKCENVQFILYNTDKLSETDLAYDCIYYHVRDDRSELHYLHNPRNPVYQIIPYCVRPSDSNEFRFNQAHPIEQELSFTFEELRSQHVAIVVSCICGRHQLMSSKSTNFI